MHHLKIKCQSESRSVFILTANLNARLFYKLWSAKMPLHLAELIFFAFSDNLSAENAKLSADSRIQRIQLLECMTEVCASVFHSCTSLHQGFKQRSLCTANGATLHKVQM